MHSPRKKERDRGQKLARPTHSQMGNPYPPGLEPVILQYGMPGVPMERCMMRPLAEAEIMPPGGIAADYLHVQPDPNWPRLRLRLAPRGRDVADERYEAYRRDIEQFTCDHAIYLGLCQELCTLLGNHHACAEGACRRNGACAGIRDQDRFEIPFVLFPPCVPLDREIIETYRQEIVAELERVVAKGEDAQRPKAEPATAGRRILSLSKGGAPAEGQPPETAVRPAGEKTPRPLPVARPAKTA